MWPFKKKRKLTLEEQKDLFQKFMFCEPNGIIEYPVDVNNMELHCIWVSCKLQKEQILRDIQRCGGTFPGAYEYK